MTQAEIENTWTARLHARRLVLAEGEFTVGADGTVILPAPAVVVPAAPMPMLESAPNNVVPLRRPAVA